MQQYRWGAPPAAYGPERLGELVQGSFYEVSAGHRVAGSTSGRRWLITFPEAMFEVRAADGEVVLRAAAAVGPAHALAALLA
jgi:hypothetical protein